MHIHCVYIIYSQDESTLRPAECRFPRVANASHFTTWKSCQQRAVYILVGLAQTMTSESKLTVFNVIYKNLQSWNWCGSALIVHQCMLLYFSSLECLHDTDQSFYSTVFGAR